MVELFGLGALDCGTKIIDELVHILNAIKSYVAFCLIPSLRANKSNIDILCQFAVFNTVHIFQTRRFNSFSKSSASNSNGIFTYGNTEVAGYQYAVNYPPSKGYYSEPPPCSNCYVEVPTPMSFVFLCHTNPFIKKFLYNNNIIHQGALS